MVTVNPALKIVIIVLSTVAIIFSLFVCYMIIYHKEHFRYQNPLFSLFILLGSIIGHISCLIIAVTKGDVICNLEVWLLGISYELVFGCLIAKTYQIWHIIKAGDKLKRSRLTRKHLLLATGLVLLLECIFLAIWSSVDPLSLQMTVNDQNLQIEKCTGQHTTIFWVVFLGIKAVTLLFGIFLSFASRNVDKSLNDSKAVGLASYILGFSMLVLIPLGFALSDVPNAVFVLRTIGCIIPYMLVILVINFKPIYNAFSGHEPHEFGTARKPQM